MIQVRFNPAKLVGEERKSWDAWATEAHDATLRVINAYEAWHPTPEDPKFVYAWNTDDRVWKDLKEFLLKHVFHGKCAYCEEKEIRSPYHAEHFRPKSLVRFKKLGEDKLDIARAESNGLQIEHPGYFWLAYHWENILPSCAYCNAFEGKKNQFPTAANRYIFSVQLDVAQVQALEEPPIPSPKRNGHYYLLSKDLDRRENPLLVNPLSENPREHICFGDCGIEAAVKGSEKGLHSIAVYDLSHDNLRMARQMAQEEGDNRYMAAKSSCRNAKVAERAKAASAAMQAYIDGKEPFSAAVLDYISISQRVDLR